MYNFTTCWNDGRPLAALLGRYRPDIIDYISLCSSGDIDDTIKKITTAVEKEYDIKSPCQSLLEWVAMDEEKRVNYIAAIVERFAGDSKRMRDLLINAIRTTAVSHKRKAHQQKITTAVEKEYDIKSPCQSLLEWVAMDEEKRVNYIAAIVERFAGDSKRMRDLVTISKRDFGLGCSRMVYYVLVKDAFQKITTAVEKEYDIKSPCQSLLEWVAMDEEKRVNYIAAIVERFAGDSKRMRDLLINAIRTTAVSHKRKAHQQVDASRAKKSEPIQQRASELLNALSSTSVMPVTNANGRRDRLVDDFLEGRHENFNDEQVDASRAKKSEPIQQRASELLNALSSTSVMPVTDANDRRDRLVDDFLEGRHENFNDEQIREALAELNDDEEKRKERHAKRLKELNERIDFKKFQKQPQGTNIETKHWTKRPQVDKLNPERIYAVPDYIKNHSKREVEKIVTGEVEAEKTRELYRNKRRQANILTRKMDQRDIDEMEAKLEQTGMGVLFNREQYRVLSSKEEKVEKIVTGEVEAEKTRELYRNKRRQANILTRKMDQRDIDEMEAKLEQTGMGVLFNREQYRVLSSKEEKIMSANAAAARQLARDGFKAGDEKYKEIDERLSKAENLLKNQNLAGVDTVSRMRINGALNVPSSSSEGQERPDEIRVFPELKGKGERDFLWARLFDVVLLGGPLSSRVGKPPPPTPPKRLTVISAINEEGHRQESDHGISVVKFRREEHTSEARRRPTSMPVMEMSYDSVNARRQHNCQLCSKAVYLAERMQVEGMFIHKKCFRCAFCEQPLRLGHCAQDRNLEKYNPRQDFNYFWKS
uniref:LIM zinc-binding domain-containing protein n=1 Tax=Ascaris lumbricoides TaxID=6252 RepID=A0A0M3IN13_ASCLU